ncbi:replication initiation factor domain-containing protein [Enterococcus termitis]
MFVRFYEKRYELASKMRMNVGEVIEEYGIWNRYELELGKDYNEQVFSDYINGVPLDDIAINLLLSKFEVYDEQVDSQGNIELVFYKEFYEVFGSWKKVKLNKKEKSLVWKDQCVALNCNGRNV